MSHYPEEANSAAESLPDAPAAPTKASARSFKKKFAKLKVQFEVRMRDSEALIREELRIQDISKRIQEQNDQLLEVLLEFNDSLHIAPDVRYDLTAPGDDDDEGAFLPTPHREPSPVPRDPTAAVSRLKDAKAELAAGRMSVDAYHDLESAIKHGKAFAPRLQYRSLIQTPHTDPRLEEGTDDRAPGSGSQFEQTLGFLTPEHETEYYLSMDAKLGDESAALQLDRASGKPSFAERERDAALRNPISVYNWLRRNQPQIFLQDNENASEKSTSRPSNLRASKRAPPQRKDDDTHDEDGSTVDTGPTSGSAKNKRKRDDETGPKKGGGSRSNRKKKEDGGSASKRSSKRSSGTGA